MGKGIKILVPELRTYNDDITKRWRIEWHVSAPGRRTKRASLYGNINRGKTVEERKSLAAKLMKSLRVDLPLITSSNIMDKVLETRSLYWRPKTISAYKTIIKKWVKYLKKVKLENANTDLVNSFLLSLKASGSSKNTIIKYRNGLHTLYKYALVGKLCKENPVSLDSKIKKESRSLNFFTDKQIALFKATEIDPQLWLGIQFLFYCFIRPGEQRNMKIEWINFECKFIDIPAQWSKNGKSQKVVIPDIFFDHVQHLQAYPNNFYILGKHGFPGLTQVSTNWLNLQHKKILDRLKIRGHYAFYSWKHTGAVKAVQAGINIKDLQLQLRHHSLDMVNEYLKNLGVNDSKDLKIRFPGIFGQKNKKTHNPNCLTSIEPHYKYCPECGEKLIF